MARGRMINQTIDYDAEFNALSIEAQLMYLRTLAFLDRDGLIYGHPRALLSKVCPLLNFTQDQMLDIMDQWVDMGLVIRYRAKVGDILFFKGFAKNQSGMHYDRESPSRFDPPPGWTHGPKGLVPITTKQPPATPQDSNQSESSEPPTEPLESDLTDSGATPAEVRRDSGETPTQIEVEVKDQDQLNRMDDEDARARDPRHQAWFDTYQAEMPKDIEALIDKRLGNCSDDAVLHAIRASVGAEERTFGYLEKCALNYLPPAPIHTNGNGSYHVDLPGIHILQPVERSTPPPPLPPPMNHDDPWAVAKSELLPTLSTQAKAWLEFSELSMSEIAGEPLCEILISHPDANIQWLIDRTEPLIRKKLGSLMRKRVNVAFIQVAATPVPTVHGEIV